MKILSAENNRSRFIKGQKVIYKKWNFWPGTVKGGACIVTYIGPHDAGYTFVKDIHGVLWSVFDCDLFPIK